MLTSVHGDRVTAPLAGGSARAHTAAVRVALRRRRELARRDDGMSLIEVIVAVALVTIVMLGGFMALDYTQSSSAQQQNILEASNLATKYEEMFQAFAYQNSGNMSPGTFTYNDTVGTVTFTTDVTFQLDDPTGTSTTPTALCLSPSTSETGEVWVITASVSWPDMTGAQPVVQTTELAPGEAGVRSLTKATVAVEVEDQNDNPLRGQQINYMITEEQAGSSGGNPPPLPNGGQTNYSTTSGCAVVNRLVANPNWDYVITLSGNPGWVSAQELSDATPNQPATAWQSVSIGEVTLAKPPLQIAQGQDELVSLQPTTYNCNIPNSTPAGIPNSCDAGNFAPAADIPVTVGNSSLTNGFYAFGDQPNTATPASILLYPYTTGYSVWAGDSIQASPGWVGYTSAQNSNPVTISVTPNGNGTVNVPVYDLDVKGTSGPVTAVAQNGSGLSYTLPPSPGGYGAGLPLGQYELEVGGSACGPKPYVWVTPSGWIASPNASGTPSGPPPSTGSVREAC